MRAPCISAVGGASIRRRAYGRQVRAPCISAGGGASIRRRAYGRRMLTPSAHMRAPWPVPIPFSRALQQPNAIPFEPSAPMLAGSVPGICVYARVWGNAPVPVRCDLALFHSSGACGSLFLLLHRSDTSQRCRPDCPSGQGPLLASTTLIKLRSKSEKNSKSPGNVPVYKNMYWKAMFGTYSEN